MTGPTHKQYSVCFAFITSMLLYKHGLTQINYYLALPILILVSQYGALFPDVDHHWASVKNKTVPNWIINKAIRLTGGKHRSWQTHSIDIVVIATIVAYYLPNILLTSGKITTVNKEVLSILMLGFVSGWLSHILSDMMTSAGVRLVCFNKYKVRLVPKSIGSLRFNTGNDWEAFNFKVVRGINLVLGFIATIYPLLHGGLYDKIISTLRMIVRGI